MPTNGRINNRVTRHTATSTKPEADAVHSADFIVDALGRHSPTPEWLYVSILPIGATPPHDPYAAVVFPEEDDAMVALIAGYNKNYPPTDPDEFEASAYLLGPEFQEPSAGPNPCQNA